MTYELYELRLEVPKEIKPRLSGDLQEEFKNEISFVEELVLEEVAAVVTIVAMSMEIIDKVKKWLKDKEGKGEIPRGTVARAKLKKRKV